MAVRRWRCSAALMMGVLGGALAMPAGAAPAGAVRVAVTDFQPGGATAEEDRPLGAGLQSMLTTDLAASNHIAVVERARLSDLRKEMKLGHSAAADPATAVKLGRLAGATHLVTGSFTLVGKQMRLDARVIDVATGRVALATNATGERDAFFELEKQIGSAIVDQLGVTLTPKERATFGRVHTADLEALRRFGDGLRLFDDGDYDRSLAALRDATGRDRDFKLASTTLEEYERIAREIRGRATVLDARREVDAALQRQQLGAQQQAVLDRLVALAGRKEVGAAARGRRAAAIYLAIRVLGGEVADGVDRFARERLLDQFVARYVHEADGLFPDVPMVPFQPLGEQYGELNPPATAAEVDRAVTDAVHHFAEGWSKDAKEVRQYKERHILLLFDNHLGRIARAMRLDTRSTADLTDHFYEESLKFSPHGRWRASALRVRAFQRQALLDIDESTRLFQAAAEVEADPDSLRALAKYIEDNAKIAAAVRMKGGASCFREWAAYTFAGEGAYAAPRFVEAAKLTDFCGTDVVRWGRVRLSDVVLFTGGIPVWPFQESSRPLSSGPRASPDATQELRYAGPNDGRRHWALLILEGVPRSGAVLSFDLSFERPADRLPNCGKGRSTECPPAGQEPRVVALFDATDVLVRAVRRGNNSRDDVPMRATAVSLAKNAAELSDGQVLLLSERMGSEGPKLGAGVSQPLSLPVNGHVTIRREPHQIVVEAGEGRARFETAPARAGFVGLLFEGAGLARISAPRVQPLP